MSRLLGDAGIILGSRALVAGLRKEPMRRALTLEIGMQNAGVGTVLAVTYFPEHPHAAILPAAYTFGCMLTGTMLHVEPKRLIVQTWRSASWPANAMDSVLTLSFWPEREGARIELVHVNVADEDFAGVSEGWVKYYWNPWRAQLST